MDLQRTDPRTSLARWVADGFDRRSAPALVAVLAMYSVVGISYRNLFDPSQGMDWLLAGIWVYLTLALVWRIDLRHDAGLVIVGLVGGAVIEWWGTHSMLWSYFTGERPPLWILPAWPIAAIAVDRLFQVADRAAPWLRRAGPLYWVVAPSFVVLMTRFVWPTIDGFATQAVVALMVGVTLVGAKPDRDLLLFFAAAFLGIFLEYWGTSRHCWTYHTKEIPPIEAVLAHGFASVAFARGVQLLDVIRRLAVGRRSEASSPA